MLCKLCNHAVDLSTMDESAVKQEAQEQFIHEFDSLTTFPDKRKQNDLGAGGK